MAAPKEMDQWGIQPGACEEDNTGHRYMPASWASGILVLIKVMDRKSHASASEVTKILLEERTWQGNTSP